MTFRPDASLDPSQVEDRRGQRGGGLLVGGGGITIVVLIASLLFGFDPTALLGVVDTVSQTQIENGPPPSECKTGADANARDDCRIVGFVGSVQKYWQDEFARRGQQYAPAKTVLFSAGTQSACGSATTAVGPFYCPEDQKVYLDLDFFKDLTSKLGAKGGPFAEGYVVAHEYGHHIQNLLGQLNQSTQTGPQSQTVRVELQADCYAGSWARNAASTGFLVEPTQAEIAQAIDAAESVGDDRIQQKTQGRVTPDSFTHGTSAQRQKWFMVGYQTGDPARCDTSGTL